MADGTTLPPMLDIEYNPYGGPCYGLTPTAMTAWIKDFSKQVKLRTTRAPVIFTTTTWWTKCTGNSPAFGVTNPLDISRWNTEPGTLPAGWATYRFWQHASAGPSRATSRSSTAPDPAADLRPRLSRLSRGRGLQRGLAGERPRRPDDVATRTNEATRNPAAAPKACTAPLTNAWSAVCPRAVACRLAAPKTVTSTATPSVPPSCCVTLTSPDAAPGVRGRHAGERRAR